MKLDVVYRQSCNCNIHLSTSVCYFASVWGAAFGADTDVGQVATFAFDPAKPFRCEGCEKEHKGPATQDDTKHHIKIQTAPTLLWKR